MLTTSNQCFISLSGGGLPNCVQKYNPPVCNKQSIKGIETHELTHLAELIFIFVPTSVWRLIGNFY